MLSFILPQKLIKDQEADYDDIQTIITSASQRNLAAASGAKKSEQVKDTYKGRKSNRVGQSVSPEADGDTWIEIVVCKKSKDGNEAPQTRSLFYSVNTQRAKWDEPPSGASKIIFKKDVESLTKKSDKRGVSISNAVSAVPRPSSHHQQPPLPRSKATRRSSKTGGVPTRARSQSPHVLKRLSAGASPGAPIDRKSKASNSLLSPKCIENRKKKPTTKSSIPRHSSTPKQRNDHVVEVGTSRQNGNSNNTRSRSRSSSRLRRTLRSMSPGLSRPSKNPEEGDKDTVASSDEERMNPAKNTNPSIKRKSPRRPSLNLEKMTSNQPHSDSDHVSSHAINSTSDGWKTSREESADDFRKWNERKQLGRRPRVPDPQRPSAPRPQLLETGDEDLAHLQGTQSSTKQQTNPSRQRRPLEDLTPQRRNNCEDTRNEDKIHNTRKADERQPPKHHEEPISHVTPKQNSLSQPQHVTNGSDLQPSLSAIESEVELYLSTLEQNIATMDQKKHLKQTKRISKIVQDQERIDRHGQVERPSSRQGSRPPERPPSLQQSRPKERPSSRQGSRPKERPSSRQRSLPEESPSCRQGSRPRERPSSRQGSRPQERPLRHDSKYPRDQPPTEQDHQSRERPSMSRSAQERPQSSHNASSQQRFSSREKSRDDATTPIDRRRLLQKNVSPDSVIVNPVSFRNLEDGKEIECVPSTRRSRGRREENTKKQPSPSVQWKTDFDKPDERTSRIQSDKERKMKELKRQREERMKRAALEI